MILSRYLNINSTPLKPSYMSCWKYTGACVKSEEIWYIPSDVTEANLAPTACNKAKW